MKITRGVAAAGMLVAAGLAVGVSLVLMGWASPAQAQSCWPFPGGTLTQTTTLAGDYCVLGSVVVPQNVVLRIEPGTWMRMADGVSLIVRSGGRLEVNGAAGQPVTFTSVVSQGCPGAGKLLSSRQARRGCCGTV